MDNFTALLIAVFGGGTFSAIATQFIIRRATERKAAAEATIVEITATQRSAEVWRETVTHLQERVKSLEVEVDGLRTMRTEGAKESEGLVKLLAAKDAEILKLNDEIVRLNKTIEGLTGRVATLEKKLLE